ncbi:hypothetical protein EZ313_14010 [Ramlibacter henchirensis]|uniref:Uncharacterized protein n=1 Tax=Ramlibacter henchirensis TaxID=204072 RepID=A0A4Z0BVT7_9BURK|nr:hypothetical protein [Ramlibacter henchirensis]TFZ02378.1 hypothetical protein EZ313_14010 [Ramlibacter henchirensis]
MARLLQQLLSPFDSAADDARDHSYLPAGDDEFALGFECANPALQFDGWEPSGALPQGSSRGY